MTKPLRKTPVAAPPRPSKAPRLGHPQGAAVTPEQTEILELQRTIGNRAVRAMLDGADSGAAALGSDETETEAEAETDTEITDTPRIKSVDMLHPEEIFASVPSNADGKKHAFTRLKQAVHASNAAEAALARAKTPKAIAAARTRLTAATGELAAATAAIQTFLANAAARRDPEIAQLASKLEKATRSKDTTAIAALTQAIAARKEEIRAEVAAMKHTEAGHTGDSVFAPVATPVTHHDFAFADGEHVKLRDHVLAYATTAPSGVDSEGPVGHAQVKKIIASSDLSGSRRKILQLISGLEGGFDTVNTYDKALLTWGFVQWTGGHESDLTRALAFIKRKHPAAFAASFQAHGIDVLRDDLVITPRDGAPALRGREAAEAVMQSPQLTAVFAHAGRNEEIQKGEVEAASNIEIEAALQQPVAFGKGKNRVATTAGALVTSEYGVGLLANAFVHHGSPTARNKVHAAIVGYLAKHAYTAGDAAWRAGAEAAIRAVLETIDHDRATALRKQLSAEPGSFR